MEFSFLPNSIIISGGALVPSLLETVADKPRTPSVVVVITSAYPVQSAQHRSADWTAYATSKRLAPGAERLERVAACIAIY
jgi:hypothetical protein